MREKRDEIADLFRCLGNPNRLAIALALTEGERAVAELDAELGIRQPMLSQQLAILREAGLVASRKTQKSTLYRLADGRADRLGLILRAAMNGEAQLPPAAQKSVSRLTERPSEAAVFAQIERRPGV